MSSRNSDILVVAETYLDDEEMEEGDDYLEDSDSEDEEEDDVDEDDDEFLADDGDEEALQKENELKAQEKQAEMRKMIVQIQKDPSLPPSEKAKRIQVEIESAPCF